jgi:hypothetical protein
MNDLYDLAEQKVKELNIVQEIIRTNEELQRTNEQLRIEKEVIEQALLKTNNNTAGGMHGTTTMNVYTNCNNRQYNTFNINLFLNEQCKNAMNLDEFMQMVEIPEERIEASKTQTIIQSISEALVTALSRLSLYERPIHCSDRKRSTLYIKENDKWDRDLEHDRMRTVIEEVNLKQFIALKQWMHAHPEYKDNDQLMMEYLQMTNHLSTDLAQNNGYRKIIHNVGQEVHIDRPSPYGAANQSPFSPLGP